MRYTYQSPRGESARFQESYSREVMGRIIPWWLLESMRLVYVAAIFAATYCLTHSLEKGYILMAWMILIQFVWQKVMAVVRKKRVARYFASKPEIETWHAEIIGDRYVNGDDVRQYSFPLPILAGVQEKEGFIFMEFPKIGRARLPVSVFPSEEEKAAFLAALEEGKRVHFNSEA